jgi:UDP-N-acetyl-D-galactosamine dehydrogenase
LAGRRLNDSMGQYVASQLVKTMIKKKITINGGKVLNLGITFKENCPDVRNTKAVDVIQALEDYSLHVTTYDPWAQPEEVKHEYDLNVVNEIPDEKFDAIILTVAHKEFMGINLNNYLKEGGIIYDVKGVLEECDSRL